jgi:hypothetical protein
MSNVKFAFKFTKFYYILRDPYKIRPKTGAHFMSNTKFHFKVTKFHYIH